MKRQLNVRFLIGLILAAALIGASFYGLHAIQVKRSAGVLLRLVNQAEAEGNRDKAIERLEHYLYYRPDDVDALIKLGTLLAPDPDDPAPRNILRAQRTLERALVVLGGSSQEPGVKGQTTGVSKTRARTTPQIDEIRSRCIELELRLGWAFRALKDRDKDALAMFQVAQSNLLALLMPDLRPGVEITRDDSQKGELKDKLAEISGHGRLKWQLGLCLEGARKYGLAEVCYQAARAVDPTLVDAYVQQANLLRNHLKDADPEGADRIMSARLTRGADDRIVPTGDPDGLIANLASPEAVRERAAQDTGPTLEVTRLAGDIARRAAEEALAAARLARRPPEGIEAGKPEAVKKAVRDASRKAVRLPEATPVAEAGRIADRAASEAEAAARAARPGAADVAGKIAELARTAAEEARRAEDRACKALTARAYLQRARYLLANQARLAAGLAQELVEAARKVAGAATAAVEAARATASDAPRRAAIADASRARDLEPEDAAALLFSAQLALTGPQPDPKAARVFLEKGRRLHPTNIEMHRLLAAVDQMDRGPQEAIARLREGIGDLPENDPGRAELQLGIAELLIQSGRDQDLRDAQKLLDQARNLAPGPQIAQSITLIEARVLVAEGKWYKAASLLERLAPELAIGAAEETDGQDRSGLAKRAFLLLAACYDHLNHPGRYSAYRRAVDIELPEDGRDNSRLNVQALLGVAQVLAEQNKLDEAIAQYQKLIARPDTPPELRGAIYRNLAWTLVVRNYQLPESRRDWDGVHAALEQARRASQQVNDPAGLGAAVLLKAQVQLARRQDKDASRDVEAALKEHPELVEPWIAKAAIKAQQNDPDGALAVLEEAERGLGRRTELLAALARYWAPLLKTEDRADAARRALDGLEDEANAILQRAKSAAKPEEATRGRDEARRLIAGLIESYKQAGAHDRARALIERAAGAFPDDLDLQVALFDQDLRDPDPKTGLAAAERLLPQIRRIDDEAKGTGDGTAWRYCQTRLRIEQARQSPGSRQSQASGPLLKEADTLVEEIRRRRPDWPALPLIQGDLDLLEGRPASALENYQKALAAGNRSTALIQQTTRLLLERSRYTEADELLKKLEAPGTLREGAHDLQRMAAAAALGAGDYERALTEARRAVAGDTKNFDELVWFGQILWAASRKARADGRQEEAQGRQIEAEKVLRQAVGLDRGRPEPWLILVQMLASSGQLPKAREAVQEAEAQLLLPANALALAQCYEAIGEDQRAYDLYQKALAAGINKPASLRALAQYCLRRVGPTQPDKLEEAKRYLDQLTQQSDSPPDRDWARQTLALLTGLGGNHQKFLEAMQILGVTSDPDPGSPTASPTDRRVQANLLATRPNQGERRKAIRILEDLTGRGLGQPADLFLLAKLYEADRRWPQARQVMERLLKAYPRNSDYLAYYVAALLRHDELNDAEVRLMDLEKLAPDQIGFRVRLLQKRKRVPEAVRLLKQFASGDRLRLEPAANLLEDLGQLDDAEALYRAIREKFAEYPTAVLPLAGFLGRHDRTREALDLLDDRAWGKLPVERASRDSIIVLYSAAMDDQNLFNEQCERVAARIEKAIQQHPDKTSLKFDLANLRSIQGRYQEAERIYREVVSKDTTSGSALNNLAWLLALEGDRNKAEEALGLVQQAIGIDGETPDLLDTRAVAYLALDDPDKAIPDLENAIAVTEGPDKDFHLARAYLKANRRDEAAERFGKLREAGFKRSGLHPLERASYDELSRALGPGGAGFRASPGPGSRPP